MDLKEFINEIEKKYGKGAVASLNNKPLELPRFTSGSLGLDKILGGGYPKGRVIEFYGPESSGKTTLATFAMISMQQQGGKCLFIDFENSFNRGFAEAHGLNAKDLIYSQPSTAEEALEVIRRGCGLFDLIVLDSVANLAPSSEVEQDSGTASVGVLSRLMSQHFRLVTPMLKQTTIIYINQLRMKIGTLYGNPETTPGGKALGYAASIRVDCRNKERLKDADNKVIGIMIKVKTIKNKTAPVQQEALVPFYFNGGINQQEELLDFALDKGVIEKKAGGVYYYKGDKLGRGRDNVKELIIPLEKEIKELCGL